MIVSMVALEVFALELSHLAILSLRSASYFSDDTTVTPLSLVGSVGR